MLNKLRTLLVALLLVPVLTLNANAFTSAVDDAVVNTPQQSGTCWYYHNGRWWQLPC